VDLVCLATSTYGDPHAEEWHPDLRHTVGYLRRQGVATRLLVAPALRPPERVLDALDGSPPRALFVDVTEENREEVLPFLTTARQVWPQTRILVGGVPATLRPGDLLREGAPLDYVVAGERDDVLREAMQRIVRAVSVRDVAGLHGRMFANPPPALLPDLDVLGPMVHDGLDEMLLLRPPEERVGYLVTSRGCYARCSFCAVADFYRISRGRSWRPWSASFVVDEMSALYERYAVRRFVFQDDLFIGPGRAGHARARAVAAEILRRSLDVEFSLCCRLSDVRADTLSELRAAGLQRLGMSIESYNQPSLDLLQKDITVTQIDRALSVLEEVGVPCEVNLIFFDPYTTLDGIRRNLDLLDRIRESDRLGYSDAFPFNELVAFPWSRVATRLTSEGLLPGGSTAPAYRDPAAARVVAFVRSLRTRLPLTFKKRLLFGSLDTIDSVVLDASARFEATRLCEAVRSWAGLVLMPRYVRAACDAVEADRQTEAALAELEARFDADVEPVRELERQIRSRLDGAGAPTSA
jgi:anaerobic magnesium-protoporphyrin IX monomethyl ester cyclase